MPQRIRAKRQLYAFSSWGIWLQHIGVLHTKQIWFIGYQWQLGILLDYGDVIGSLHRIWDNFVSAKR